VASLILLQLSFITPEDMSASVNLIFDLKYLLNFQYPQSLLRGVPFSKINNSHFPQPISKQFFMDRCFINFRISRLLCLSPGLYCI
jgi:hypothetical protein